MKLTLSEKILNSHMAGDSAAEIQLQIDQTLTQDSTGTMTYLQLEAMNIDRVKTKRSIAYIDHNTLQSGFENADDHKFIQTVAKKYGIYFSKPGNGICHQVHLERFSVPGETLLGSDSHTPTCGAMGMIAIGAGGLDVAMAMAGKPYTIPRPEIVNIILTGRLKNGVSSKDIILKLLQVFKVKGGVNKIFEYSGDGVSTLSIPERATITNMGAELGATASIFPSDDVTLDFLRAQKRKNDFKRLKADEGASYDHVFELELSTLFPMVACPHSPDNVHEVSSLEKIRVDQVAIGSCTNSSFKDLMKVAGILDGRTIHEDVSLVIAPGSKQVLTMLASNGALAKLISSGARILESACGPCIGMGQSPKSGGVSLRTFNRNFKGRSGTADADIYLVSPETAAVSALTGYLTSPHDCDIPDFSDYKDPKDFIINDNMVISPSSDGKYVDVYKGPNIKDFPNTNPLSRHIEKKVIIKLEDNITTDHIMPSNAKLLPYRSNIPYLSEFCLAPCDPDFCKNAKENGGGIIVAGHNYGQGSSREHAALAPLYLSIKAVFAKSFARIHKKNLINNGILALEFADESDYDSIDKMDEIVIEDSLELLENGQITALNKTKDKKFILKANLSRNERDILIAGGLLNTVKNSKEDGINE